MEASHRPKQAQHFSTCRKVQNGNSRVHPDFPDSRGMGIVDRSVRRLPTYPHPPNLKEIPKVLLQGSGVPVHLPPVRAGHSPQGLYNDCKGSETNGPLKRTQNSPIPGRLADQVPVSGGSPSEHTGSGRPNPVLGVDNKSGKIRTETYSGVFVRGLRIPPRFSPCKTHSREMAQTSGFDPTTQVKMCFDCKMFDVSNWVASLNGENGSGGTPSHEALSVSSQGALEISSVAGQPPSLDRSHCSPPRLVAKSLKHDDRRRPSSQRPQYPTLYRRLKRRLGRSLRPILYKGSVGEKRLHINVLELKAVSLALRDFRDQCQNQTVLVATDNSTVIAYINKRGGTHSAEMCALLWKIMTWCHHYHIILKARHIPGCLNVMADLLSRSNQVQLTEWSLHPQVFKQICQKWFTPHVDLFATHLNHKLPLYVSPIPDPKAWDIDALNINWTNLTAYAYPPTALLHKVIQKIRQCHCLIIVIAPGWPGMPWFWDLVQLSTEIPLQLPVSTSLLKQSHKYVFHNNPQHLNLHASCLGADNSQEQGLSVEVAERIAAPQRSSTRTIYKSKWALFEKWCRENSVDFSTPSVKPISDFFMYLYQDLNRRPSTIDGYRTAIVDTLGPSAQHIAHNADLHRLLSSFHRDRPKSSRNLPKWNLSVVLNELTKAPFEPMKDTDLKHLTLKTAFLLALASGKRRSEIHAWVANKVSNLGQWEKVSLFPSSDFIAKNQLAREGSQSVSPVTIPALITIVDRQFKEDRTLCPIRALRYYLDRTKDLRGSRSLLFISFKKGHTSDIRPATLSSWLKQTILLCYKQADQQALDLVQVKAHDIRAFAASKAFYGGVSVDQIMQACYWKAHNTFTNFYLKDLTWSDTDNDMYLGPVVAAQQVLDPSPQTSCARKEKRGGGGGGGGCTSTTTKSSGVSPRI